MSARKTLRLSSVAAIALAPFVLAGAANAQGYTPSTAKGDWPMYFADPTGSRFSPQDQINASNFNKLEVAWHFKTDNLGAKPEYKLEGTPIMVKGTGRGGKDKELRVAGAEFDHCVGHRANKGRVLPEKIKPLALAQTRAASAEG